MATQKRRMMLSLPPELEHAFDEFREATGTAPASFVVEMLMQAVPMIESISKAARMAKQGNLEAFDVLNNSLAGALHQGMGVQTDMLEKSSQLRKARSDAATPPKKNRKRPASLTAAQEAKEDAKAAEARSMGILAGDDAIQGTRTMSYCITLDGLHLHHYGQGVYGWGPVSSTTGQPGQLVEWTLRCEAEEWISKRPVFCSGSTVTEFPETTTQGKAIK